MALIPLLIINGLRSRNVKVRLTCVLLLRIRQLIQLLNITITRSKKLVRRILATLHCHLKSVRVPRKSAIILAILCVRIISRLKRILTLIAFNIRNSRNRRIFYALSRMNLR